MLESDQTASADIKTKPISEVASEVEAANTIEKVLDEHVTKQHVKEVEPTTKPIEELLIQTTMFKGPLPPPQLLAEYEKCVPGSVDKIFEMARVESEHRRKLETKVVDTQTLIPRLAAMSGLMVMCLGFLVAMVFAAQGNAVAALGIVSALSVPSIISHWSNGGMSKPIAKKEEAK